MIEVTWYDATGRALGRTIYASRLLAWRMVAWRQRVYPSVTVSIRNLAKGERYGDY